MTLNDKIVGLIVLGIFIVIFTVIIPALVKNALQFSEFEYIKLKQTPKKPKNENNSHSYYCHDCNKAVRTYLDKEYYPYCKWCGQALDWGDIQSNSSESPKDNPKHSTDRITEKLKPCPNCKKFPKIKEGYDTLQVVCECGKKGKLYVGDYYDEGFMMSTYKEQVIEDWNGSDENEQN